MRGYIIRIPYKRTLFKVNNCMEIMALKGKPREARELADTLRAVKGVKHGTLNMSSTGKEMG